MREVLHGFQGTALSESIVFADPADEAILSSPLGRALMARIDGAVGEFFSADIDRDRHVKRIALTVAGFRLTAGPNNLRPPTGGPEQEERHVRNDAA